MNRNIVFASISGVAIILIGVSLYYFSSPSEVENDFCSDNPEAAECQYGLTIEGLQRIKSDDDSAELMIPRESLPDNVEIEDISVTRLSDSQFEDSEIITYSLEPDGLEFKNEIVFQTSIDSFDEMIPIAYVSTSNGIELVNNTISGKDLENNKKIVNVPLTHFSKLYITRTGAFKLIASISDTFVGDSIQTTASFTLFRDNINFGVTAGQYLNVLKLLEPSVRIRGSWHTASLNISPAKIGGLPRNTDVIVGQTFTIDDDSFKCINETKTQTWDTELFYMIEISINAQELLYDTEEDFLAEKSSSSKIKRNFVIRSYVFNLFTCLSKEDKVADISQDEPDIEPEVVLSYNYTYSQNMRVSTKIIVDIKGLPNLNGTVTLSGPDMIDIPEKVFIDNSGQTQVIFIVYANGEYTANIKIGEYTIEKSIFA